MAQKQVEPDDELEDEDDEGDEDEDESPDYDAKKAVGAFRTFFNFIKPYYRQSRNSLSLLVIGVLFETAYNVAFPLSLKYLIDDALYEEDSEALTWILIVLGSLGVINSVVSFGYEYINARLGAAVLQNIRQRMFEHLQTLSLNFYSHTKVGEVLSRFSTDLTEVEESVVNGISWGLLPLLELVTAIALLFYLNWQLALAAMLVLPLTLISPKLISPRAIAATYKKKQLEAETLSVIQENVVSQPVIKAFGLHVTALNWFSQRNVPLAQTAARVNFLTALVERSVTTAVMLLHLLILGLGAWLTFEKQITIGTLVTFESVFWELSYNIGHLSQFMPVLIQSAGSIQHIQEMLDVKPNISDAPDAITIPRLEREIVFERVSFSYEAEKKAPQLKNVSFRIPNNSRAAIIGASGSGKSTVLNLLLRLYEPNAGSIKIDGSDLRQVTRESLLGQMALVFQENILFNTTIRENIRLGNLSATDDEVEAAARAAEIHSFIKSLPKGYDTIAGERGSLMSGGQRQRIAIARAIIRNPAILILDEATSALDQGTEAAILSTVRKLSKGRTVIMVTHRLSSVVDAEKIFVLDQGRLVEEGTHQELLARKGKYLQLWEKQAAQDSV